MPPIVQSVGAGAVTSGQCCFYYYDIGPQNITLQSLGCQVTTAQVTGTTTTSLAIYPDSASSCFPDLSSGPLASGTVTVTSLGVKTVSTSQVLTANTRYWSCFLYFQSVAPGTAPQFQVATNTTTLWVTNANFLTTSRYVAIGGKTSLPNTQPADTSWLTNLNSQGPIVGFRVA